MKTLPLLLAFASLSFCHVSHGQASTDICYDPNLRADTSKKSIPSMAFALVNNDSIAIRYHSPAVRGRIIWGGLVPWGEVWVTGAHNATRLELPFDISMNGKKIPKGRYALFTIPSKDAWTIIINANWNQHLAWDYDPKDDLVRMTVRPKKTSHLERLQYFIGMKDQQKGSITMRWEKLSVSWPFELL